MKMTVAGLIAVVFLSTPLVVAQEHEEKSSKVERTPQWEKMTSLTGEWEGYMLQGSQKMPTRISIRMTGDGSALMHCMDPGGPHEMITMFHMDKSELLATHYCAAHNQPRFRALPSQKPNEVAFEFRDGTNIRQGDGFMRRLVITFVDADHHNETWGYDDNGKVGDGTFFMTRVKQPVKK